MLVSESIYEAANMTSAAAIAISEACAGELDTWDDRVASSVNGTIFHERRFLAYHGTRFAGRERFVVVREGGTAIAQIALSVEDSEEGQLARSPYGGSYGGVVFYAAPTFQRANAVVQAFISYLQDSGVSRFTVTHPTYPCGTISLDGYYLALMLNGFRSISRDVTHVFALASKAEDVIPASSRVARMCRKAADKGVTIVRGNLDDFWFVMDRTFAKHGTHPTHTKAEFASLMAAYPERVYVDVAYDSDGVPVSGLGYISLNSAVNSGFYLCQDPARRELQAQTFLVMHALRQSSERQFLWFDFGTSSINMVPRPNIFEFKENFTRTCFFRETFEWRKQ